MYSHGTYQKTRAIMYTYLYVKNITHTVQSLSLPSSPRARCPNTGTFSKSGALMPTANSGTVNGPTGQRVNIEDT